MTYPITERLLPLGTNRPGTPIKVRGIVSHRTGNSNTGADAQAHYRYFSGGDRKSSAHYFVDQENILRIIPEHEMAWHAGLVTNSDWTKGNPNSWTLGIEYCENFPYLSPEGVAAYRRYVWLHADICLRYGLDPRQDIYGHFMIDPRNRGTDPIGLFQWNPFIEDVVREKERIRQESAVKTLTPILGKTVAALEQSREWLKTKAPDWVSLSDLYYTIAFKYNLRADVALAQACKETAFFRFDGLVKREQNNYCGLGATGPGDPGASFPDPATGVEAHIQHLYAYATANPLPAGVALVDPRFNLVQRGTAAYVEYLGAAENPAKVGWAYPGVDYGKSIIRDYLLPLLATIVPLPEDDPRIKALQVEVEKLNQQLTTAKNRIDHLIEIIRQADGLLANEL